MIEQLINKETEDLKNKLSAILDEYNLLNNKLSTLSQSLDELKKSKENIVLEPIPEKNQFNIFKRIFFNKYNKACSEIIKTNNNKTEMIAKLDAEIVKSESKINEVVSKINSIDLDKVESDLNVEVNIDFLINKYSELASNIDFMKEAIMIDPNYLQFDKTNDPALYMYVADSLIDKIQSGELTSSPYDKEVMIDSLSSYKKIVNQGDQINGKYRIPIEYLNESIRKSITITLKDKYVYNFFNSINSYITLNDKLPQEYGEKLQTLWEDKNIRVGVHGMFGSPDLQERRELVNTIFKEGLRTSQQQIGITDLRFTAKVQDYDPSFSFLDTIDYTDGTGGFIILAIPEKCFEKDSTMPIWGGNNPEAMGQEFVLPEYVLGYVPQDEKYRSDEYFNNRKIIYNEEIDKKTYNYFFKNGMTSELMEPSNYER